MTNNPLPGPRPAFPSIKLMDLMPKQGIIPAPGQVYIPGQPLGVNPATPQIGVEPDAAGQE